MQYQPVHDVTWSVVVYVDTAALSMNPSAACSLENKISKNVLQNYSNNKKCEVLKIIRMKYGYIENTIRSHYVVAVPFYFQNKITVQYFLQKRSPSCDH